MLKLAQTPFAWIGCHWSSSTSTPTTFRHPNRTHLRRSQPSLHPRLKTLALPSLLLALSAGCSVVPGTRLQDCRTRVQALQAESQELRDITVSLRQENKDMAQRAVETARLLETQQEAVARLERSIAEYQGERDALAAQLDAIKSQVRTASLAPPTTALLDRLEQFSHDHPECRVDRNLSAIALPADRLFPLGSTQLAPTGASLLDALAQTLQSDTEGGLSLLVLGPPSGGSPSVIPASATTEPPSQSSLGLNRARSVRDRLSDRSGIPRSLFSVSAGSPPAQNPSPDGIEPASTSPPDPSWLVIQIRRLTDPVPQ